MRWRDHGSRQPAFAEWVIHGRCCTRGAGRGDSPIDLGPRIAVPPAAGRVACARRARYSPLKLAAWAATAAAGPGGGGAPRPRSSSEGGCVRLLVVLGACHASLVPRLDAICYPQRRNGPGNRLRAFDGSQHGAPLSATALAVAGVPPTFPNRCCAVTPRARSELSATAHAHAGRRPERRVA